MAGALRRRFTIFDAMILLAALAMGFAMIRLVEIEPRNFGGAYWLLDGVRPGIYPATVAVVALSSYHTRSRRHAFRCPGVAACLAVLIASGAALIFYVDPWLLRYLRGDPSRLKHGFWAGTDGFFWYLTYSLPACAAILSVWALLLAQGRWRTEPSWLDRFGRLLAVLWILDALALGIYTCFLRLYR